MTTRQRLFDAARNIFERDGLDALTIRAVGRQAGMSAMAIYRHFQDKDALINALMEDGLAAWEAIVDEIDSGDALLWLKQVVASYGEFALADPHRFDAAFLLPAPRARTFPTGFEEGRSPVVNKMIAQIKRAQAEGRISEESPLQLALLLAAMAQGLVSMHRAGRFGSDDQFRVNYQLAMDRLLVGLGKGDVQAKGSSRIRKGKQA
jgi:AcrR family transcriptional regulator